MSAEIESIVSEAGYRTIRPRLLITTIHFYLILALKCIFNMKMKIT